MTERVEIGNATLYCGDCREVLPTLTGIDACISDPPYGIDYDYRKVHIKPNGNPYLTNKGYRFNDIEKMKSWPKVIGDGEKFEPQHLLHYRQIILFGANHYSDLLPASAKWIIWDKRPGLPSLKFADCEMAWTNLKGPARMHRQLWNGIQKQSSELVKGRFDRQHPSQKPIELMRYCIAQLDDKTQTVLDPYMGSGTTGIAAHEAGLRFIGVEIDRTYFDIACERIENAQRQDRLAL